VRGSDGDAYSETAAPAAVGSQAVGAALGGGAAVIISVGGGGIVCTD